jgi:D-sedoheptulose 7-phosphate isomerase
LRSEAAPSIRAQLEQSASVVGLMAQHQDQTLAAAADIVAEALRAGHKLLLCGNGGSAADAQHVATELLARYKLERQALPAIALSTDVTFLTAMSNDYDFSQVFSRQIEGLAGPGDVLWAFSTSGNSPNVLRAAQTARERQMRTLGFTGESGGKLAAEVELCLRVPSSDTPRIQEAHMAAAHAICDYVERACAQAVARAGTIEARREDAGRESASRTLRV